MCKYLELQVVSFWGHVSESVVFAVFGPVCVEPLQLCSMKMGLLFTNIETALIIEKNIDI